MLGLPHAECLTLTIGAFLAVRSIVLASQAEQKTIPLQPELSEVAHECVSTEAELARRLQAAEAALAAKDAELAAERERLRAPPGREGEAQVGQDVRHGPVLRRGVPPVDLDVVSNSELERISFLTFYLTFI